MIDLDSSISVDAHGEVLSVGDVIEYTTQGFVKGSLPYACVQRVVTEGEDGRFFRLFFRSQGAWCDTGAAMPTWFESHQMRKVPSEDAC